MNAGIVSAFSGLSSGGSSLMSSGMMPSTSESLLNMYSYIYSNNKSNSTTSGASAYQVSLKENSGKLKSSIDELTQKGSKSLFNRINAVSDSDAVKATYTGTDKGEELEVDVEQIATTQKNEGKTLKSDSSSLSSNSLTITLDNGFSKSFYVSGGAMTNKEAQEKLAEKINNSTLGISAKVVTNEKKGTSQLVLESKQTGTKNSFSVSGKLAEELGIDKKTQEAKDAIYSINGERNISSSNEIEVNDDLKLTLRDKTTETANITYSRNDLSSINAVRELVNNYNALLNTAKKYTDTGAQRLESQLIGAANTYSYDLNKIGISTNEKGYLEIDEDKMAKSAESGELAKFFGASSNNNYSSSGFVNRISTIAESVNNDPTQYLSEQGKMQLKNQNNSSSKTNITSNSVSRNYIQKYFSLSATSMLLDSLI